MADNRRKISFFPVFLKPEKLSILIVGDGKSEYDRVLFLIKEFNPLEIKIIAPQISSELNHLAKEYSIINIVEKNLEEKDFHNVHLAFFTCQIEDANTLKNLASKYSVLVHFSHFPEFNDFEEIVPVESDIANSEKIEHFKKKIATLQKLSKDFSENLESADPFEQLENTTKIAKAAQLKSNVYLAIIGVLVFIALLGITINEFNLYIEVKDFLAKDHYIFFWMLLVGFLAEIIAGSMGMGYGIICTTILLLLNVPPPLVSASIHSAESFTSAAGSMSHFKLGNVNMKLVKRLAPFAILGAIIGSLSLTYFGEHYAHIVKPLIAFYTLYIGINILRKSLMKSRKISKNRKRSNLTFLGIIGGFIDSFAGGGWGPLVTGSLIKDGRTPRYVIGSSTLTKFMLTITSAITFVYTIGIHHWNIVLGLLIGGIVTAPFSAMLTAKLPVKKMTIFISILVIIMSSITIVKSVF